jgi:hypothetical protein
MYNSVLIKSKLTHGLGLQDQVVTYYELNFDANWDVTK